MNTENETQHAELDAVIASLGLSFQAVQIPARTDGVASDWDKGAFHFAVTISNARGTWSGNYSMGSGHATFAPWEKTRELTRKDYDRISRRGFTPRTLFDEEAVKKYRLPPVPTLRDVLYSLVSDADAIDCATFEDWASNYGYDTDSRSAEKAYRACLESGLKLRAMLGEEALTKLRELFQDY